MSCDSQSTSPDVTPAEAKSWARILGHYRDPSLWRSLVEIVSTAGPLIALWVLMWLCLQVSYWLCLAVAVPAAFFMVRLFLIQHDCSHDAYFRNRLTNAWVPHHRRLHADAA